MAVLVEMPRLSDTMREGTIEKWIKNVGDSVESGDVVAEIETDKAVMEWEATDDGVLLAVFVAEKGTIEVGAPLCIIGEEGEDISELVAQAESRGESSEEAAPEAAPATPAPEAKVAAVEPPPKAATPKTAAPKKAAPKPGPAAPAEGGGHRISPLAARMAADRNVNLSLVKGTGPGGRIVKRDVLEAQTRKKEIVPSAAATGFSPTGSEYEDTGASQMRRVITERLLESKNGAPHFYLTVSVDMGPALAMRKQINESQSRARISVNDLVVKAAALASRRVPAVNAAWVDDGKAAQIRHYRDVHVGVAVALEEGLVTPVLRHADRRSVVDLSVETRDLVGQAKSRRLDPAAYQGNTVTVSNLGMFGIEQFTAIINPPASLILAVGASAQVPVVVDGQLAVGDRMKVTLSCDHRVVDGALGAQWLQAFQDLMEHPIQILAGA